MIQKKHTIAFVTNNYTPYSGGVVSSINVYVQELRARGHAVFIITLDFLGESHDDPPYVKRVPCPIKFTYKGNCMAVPWLPDMQVKKILAELKPDIVHSQHPFLLGVSALKAARELQMPIVFTYHTIYQEYAHYVPLPQAMTKGYIAKTVAAYCREVDGVIVPTELIKKLVKKSKPQRIEVIPSGLQDMFLRQQLIDVGRCVHDPLRLLYVGRFAQEKRVEALLDVCSLLNAYGQEYTLTLVGYGPEYEQLQSLAYDNYKFSEKVVNFVHKPPKDCLLGSYRSADLFLFPSPSDTQGLVLVEAMACGLPVIALAGPGQEALIEQGDNGFIVKDAVQMARLIRTVAQDRDIYRELRANALRTAQGYAPAKLVEKLLSFYNQVRAAKPTSGPHGHGEHF